MVSTKWPAPPCQERHCFWIIDDGIGMIGPCPASPTIMMWPQGTDHRYVV